MMDFDTAIKQRGWDFIEERTHYRIDRRLIEMRFTVVRYGKRPPHTLRRETFLVSALPERFERAFWNKCPLGFEKPEIAEP